MKSCSSCSSLRTRANCPDCTGWPKYEGWEPANPLPLPVGVFYLILHHTLGHLYAMSEQFTPVEGFRFVGYRVPPESAAVFARGLRSLPNPATMPHYQHRERTI